MKKIRKKKTKKKKKEKRKRKKSALPHAGHFHSLVFCPVHSGKYFGASGKKIFGF